MKVHFTIEIPSWLDRICVWPVMVYRRVRYGYAFRRIALTQGRFAIVEQEGYYALSRFKWTLLNCHRRQYAIRSVWDERERKNRHIFMHRLVMSPPDDMYVDHINGDGLDNRRANLRVVSRLHNCWNRRKQATPSSSRFKGVTKRKGSKKWKACIRFDKRLIDLGLFEDEVEAGRAYDEAARRYYGEFAQLNFPENG